jgi:hypothetical protein
MFVDFGGRQNRPPSGGPCPDQWNRSRRRQSYIALLAEGRLIPPGVYKRIMKGCPSRCSLELLENQITARRNTL